MQQVHEPLLLFIHADVDITKIYDLQAYIKDAINLKVVIEDSVHVIVWESGNCCNLDAINIIVGKSAKVFWISDCPHVSISVECLEASSFYFVQVVEHLLVASKQRLVISMQEHCSQAYIRIFPFLLDDQQFKCYTEQLHVDSTTSSSLRIVGSVGGNAQFGHTGMITVKPYLYDIDVVQNTIMYMLSKHAVAHANPCFDVASRNIRCTHGAALGAVDEDQCKYLQSRGINQIVAEAIIIKACCLSSLDTWLPAIVYERICSMLCKER